MLTTETLIPTSYVIMSRTTQCACCGRISSVSEVYAKFLIRPRNNLGVPTRDLKRIDRAEYNVPIERTMAPRSVVPFCFDCPTPINLNHLPTPPSEARLHDLAEPAPKGAGTRAQAKPAKPTTHKPRLEDLA